MIHGLTHIQSEPIKTSEVSKHMKQLSTFGYPNKGKLWYVQTSRGEGETDECIVYVPNDGQLDVHGYLACHGESLYAIPIGASGEFNYRYTSEIYSVYHHHCSNSKHTPSNQVPLYDLTTPLAELWMKRGEIQIEITNHLNTKSEATVCQLPCVLKDGDSKRLVGIDFGTIETDGKMQVFASVDWKDYLSPRSAFRIVGTYGSEQLRNDVMCMRRLIAPSWIPDIEAWFIEEILGFKCTTQIIRPVEID